MERFEFKRFCGVKGAIWEDGKRVVKTAYGYLYILFNVTCMLKGETFERGKTIGIKFPGPTKKQAIEQFKKEYL